MKKKIPHNSALNNHTTYNKHKHKPILHIDKSQLLFFIIRKQNKPKNEKKKIANAFSLTKHALVLNLKKKKKKRLN